MCSMDAFIYVRSASCEWLIVSALHVDYIPLVLGQKALFCNLNWTCWFEVSTLPMVLNLIKV